MTGRRITPNQIQRITRGFTIVELLIVIVVIGILATLAIIAYTGVQSKAIIALVTEDLQQANKQLSIYHSENNETYPVDLANTNNGTGLKFNSQSTLIYTAYNENTPVTYCLTALVGTIVYHVEANAPPVQGYCPDHEPLGIVAAPAINTTVNSYSQITVDWDLVDDADSYSIQYTPDASFMSGISTISGITAATQAVTGLNPSTTYYFRAFSVNSVGTSTASSVVSDDTPAAPIAGSPDCTVAVNSPSQITVSWTSVPGAVSYTIEYSTSSTYTTKTTLSGLTTSPRVITGLSAGIKYYVRCFSVNASAVAGPTSPSATGITTISAPDSPTVSASIPGSARAASSGPWAKNYHGDPSSGTWYYVVAAMSSSTCASGTTKEYRARMQYNSPTTWGAWTGWTTSSSFYAVQPNSGYGARFEAQTHCKTSNYTSSGSAYSYGCRWRSGSTTCSGF
ncbi:MAG: prepilin-type N-terminal cleavage/methylation domain-containing protein [Candidatus Saccharimonadales bacterium]